MADRVSVPGRGSAPAARAMALATVVAGSVGRAGVLDVAVPALGGVGSVAMGAPAGAGGIERLVETWRSALRELSVRVTGVLSELSAGRALASALRGELLELRLGLVALRASLIEIVARLELGAVDPRVRALLAEIRSELVSIGLSGRLIGELRPTRVDFRRLEVVVEELRRLAAADVQLALAAGDMYPGLSDASWGAPVSPRALDAERAGGVRPTRAKPSSAPSERRRSPDGGGSTTSSTAGASAFQSPVFSVLGVLVATALVMALFLTRLAGPVAGRMPLLLAARLERPG